MCLDIKIFGLYKNNHKRCKLASYYFHLSLGQYSTKFSYKGVLSEVTIKKHLHIFLVKKKRKKRKGEKMGTKFMTDFRNGTRSQ